MSRTASASGGLLVQSAVAGHCASALAKLQQTPPVLESWLVSVNYILANTQICVTETMGRGPGQSLPKVATELCFYEDTLLGSALPGDDSSSEKCLASLSG